MTWQCVHVCATFSNGVGRTGAFCAVYTGVQEINQGHSLVSVMELVTQLRQRRRSMVHDRELLQFCYHAILYYAQDLLMKSEFGENRGHSWFWCPFVHHRVFVYCMS